LFTLASARRIGGDKGGRRDGKEGREGKGEREKKREKGKGKGRGGEGRGGEAGELVM
jgi:hypothetical protein